MFRKKHLAIIFLFLLTFGSLTSPPKVGEKQEGFQVPPGFLPNPVLGSEEENIDTFSVFPSSRWTESNVGYSPTISDNLLEMTDIGDGSTDYYKITRDLNSLDDSIEMRFKYDSDTDVTSINWLIFELAQDIDVKYFQFGLFDPRANGYHRTRLAFNDVDNNFQSKTLTGGERVFSDIWYILKIKYDILRSTLNIRMTFDNGTTVFDYEMLDISLERPQLYSVTDLKFIIWSQSITNNVKLEAYIDYVDAPFKEYEWIQTDTPADADYLQDSWHLAKARDDIDDQSEWQLTAPYLDAISGVMSLRPKDTGVLLATTDLPVFQFILNGVDADDGGLHEIAVIHIQYFGIVQTSTIRIKDGDGTELDEYNIGPSGTAWPRVSFSFSLQNNRSRVDLKARAWPDADAEDTYFDIVATIDVSDHVDDPSQEFVIATNFDMDFDSNTEVNMLLEDFAFETKDLFTGLVLPFIGGIIAWIISIFVMIFGPILLWLGGIFKFVGDVIVGGIGIFFTLLQAFLEDPLGFISDIFDFLGGMIAAIWAYVEDWLPILLGWLEGLFSELVSFLAGLFFFIWDAIGLPNVLLWLDAFLQVLSDGLDILSATITFFLAILTIAAGLLFLIHFFIPIIIGDTQGGYWEAWFSIAGFDITFDLPLLPKVPLILPSFLIWLGVLADTPYIGFF